MPPALKFDDTLGAALIGFSFSCVIFGVLSAQCFAYFRRYPLDRPAYKALVAAIWMLEIADQALIGHAVYFYTITNYASPLAIIMGDTAFSLILQLVVGATVGTLVKGCFAMRVWRFSNRNLPITALLMVLIFGQYGLAIFYAVKAFELNKFQYADRLKLVASLALGAGALTDIITAGALCFFLRKLRTGYKQSDSLVSSLTMYALNTGALTSAISILTLVLYNVNPRNFIFIGFYFVLSKLYANSFLCTLNTRRIVRGRGTDRQYAAGETGNTSRSTNVNIYGGNSFSGGQYRYPRAPISLPHVSHAHAQTKSQLEVGVHQEVSIVSDVEDGESPTGASNLAKDAARESSNYFSQKSPQPEPITYGYNPYSRRF